MAPFVILNGAGYRWGMETWPSIEAARSEVRSFFKGDKVNFGNFAIVPLSEAPDPSKQYIAVGAVTAA